MNGAVAGADDEGRLDPGLIAETFGEIGARRHREKIQERRFAFAENDRASADD